MPGSAASPEIGLLESFQYELDAYRSGTTMDVASAVEFRTDSCIDGYALVGEVASLSTNDWSHLWMDSGAGFKHERLEGIGPRAATRATPGGNWFPARPLVARKNAWLHGV